MAHRRGIGTHFGFGRTLALASAALTLLILLPARAFAQGPVTRSVSHDPACDGHTFCSSTIQAAVTAAQPGDTVRVLASTYVEHLNVQGKNNVAGATEARRIVAEADPTLAPGAAVIVGAVSQCTSDLAVRFQQSKFVTPRGFTITGVGGAAIALKGLSFLELARGILPVPMAALRRRSRARAEPMFRIELLPAAHGDAIWIEYGDPKRPRRIVIDGGPAPTYERALFARLRMLPPKDQHIDLFVVTHIDADHIDGAVILLRQAAELGVRFDEIWFNAWRHLPSDGPDTFQPLQGEFLGALIGEGRFRDVWNARAQGHAIVVKDKGLLPAWPLPGGARLTLLSPGARQIKRLRARWASAIRDFSPGDRKEALRRLEARREYRPPPVPPVFGGRSYGDDRSLANGSSIAFLLEYDGASCLLGGDAYARVLAASLRRLVEDRTPGRGGPLRVDAIKLAHHGSLSNVSDELLAAVDCRRWLVSTNGAVFGHPDRETAELVAKHAPDSEFLCNYKSATTLLLADRRAKPRWRTYYPGEGAPAGPVGGVVLDLSRPARQRRATSGGATGRPRAASGRRPGG